MRTHLTESLIDSYVAGDLDTTQRQQVEQHAYECDNCQRSITIASLSLRVERHIQALLSEPDEVNEMVA